jgi:carbon storage regulator CsrA
VLIITRKKDQEVVLVTPTGDRIQVRVLEVGRNRTRFGIEAPQNVKIETKSPACEHHHKVSQ